MVFSYPILSNAVSLSHDFLLFSFRRQFSTLSLVPSAQTSSYVSCSRVIMSSSDSLPPLPDNCIVLGVGGAAVDFLAAVASYPKPDDKIRSRSLKVQGGGNAGNAMTCVARLGLKPRIISKIADDSQGRSILEEFESDGVDTSFLVVSKDGNSPFTYVIVDNQTKTRTCIHTPGYPPMIADDLQPSSLLAGLDGARVVYSDGRLPEVAILVAQEAAHKSIPILIDAERKREGLDDLLPLASYAVCSVKFPQDFCKANICHVYPQYRPAYCHIKLASKTTVHESLILQAWTEAPSIPSALVSMLLRLPNIEFVIVTLGEDGCIMLQRSTNEAPASEEADVDILLESLKQRKDDTIAIPTCFSSPLTKLHANGIGTVSGRLFVGTAEKIPPQELLDTTGAGDAFIGAVLYAICTNMSPEKMLPFAARVAAAACRALGARTGLPRRTDLAPFLH